MRRCPRGRLCSLSVVCLTFLIPLLIGTALAADPPRSATAPRLTENEFRLMPAGSGHLQLAHGFVEASSVRLFVDGRLWRMDTDYKVRARSGIIIPLRDWRAPEPAGDASPAGKALVMVEYRFLPVPVTPRRDLRPIGSAPAAGTAAEAAPLFTAPAEQEAWRSGNLQVSGSKTVQVSSGSRREMTVDQNLRLSIVGQLTRDISVRAYLSDDNLPVVPEGNTEELRDIDKVLVEMEAPDWKATLGDFVAGRTGTAFGNYRRKLQGFSLEAEPGNFSAEVLAGSPRGLYRTLQIRGQESNQGPYYLGGSAAKGNLFVIAGSERVTLDGQPLVRGADRDYVIDYVAGTVTFTYRRLITAESTIVIEYEEGEGPYGRTVVGGGGGAAFHLPLVDLPVDFKARVIREKDDPARLRTGELGEDDEAILAAAGDDPLRAIADGVTATAPGEGLYDQQDEGGKIIYVHNPVGGGFDLTLFYAGPGRGDYDLDRLTATGRKVFVHKGDLQGSYLIGRPLPMPESHSIATLTAVMGDTTGVFMTGEWNAGNRDLNQLSDLDNEDNSGAAGRFTGGLRELPLALGDMSFGRLDLMGFWESRDAEFKPFQVHKTVFDYDHWGLADRARRPGFLEQDDRESGVQAAWATGGPKTGLTMKGNLGSLRHGVSLKADQLAGSADWKLWGGRGNHVLQTAEATDGQDPLEIRRDLRTHEISWEVGPVVPRAGYGFRRWRNGAATQGQASGFRLEETSVGLGSAPSRVLTWQVDFERGLADSLYAGTWELQRDSRTVRSGLTTGRFAGMRLVGEGTYRRILQPDQPEQTTRLARLNLSGDWDRIFSDWALGYRVDNSRTAVLDRQILFVGEGQGDYNQDGEFVGKGQGAYTVILAATDSLVATTSVRADLNWRQGFRFLGADRWYGAWSSLVLASVEGRSTTEDIGGLLALDPKVLFDPSTTVLGDLIYTHELTFLQNVRTLDVRGKFDFRQALDRQFADHPEDRINRTWQANANLNLSRRSAVTMLWGRQDERRYSQEGSASARGSFVVLTRRYELGYNYTPTTNLRLGLQGEFLTRNDEVSGVSQEELALRPTVRSRFRRSWTLLGEVRISDVKSDEPPGAVRPWFFSFPGRNVESSLRLAWDPTEFLAVSASWFTRKKTEGRWQHDVRLETTARF
ncbi:MAG: hypothetical protein ABFS42_05415 [Candidatus Krumholzibacteriota bacterium]